MTLEMLGISAIAELDGITRDQLERSFGTLKCHSSRRINFISSPKGLTMAQSLQSERVIPRNVGTQDHLQSKDEEQAGRTVTTSEDQRIRRDLDGREIQVHERRKVDEGETRRRGLLEMNARGHERTFASLAARKIPWGPVMFLGLVLFSSRG